MNMKLFFHPIFIFSDMLTKRSALAVAAMTSITWGFTGIFVRLLPGLSPLTITAGRLVIGLAAVLPLVLMFRETRSSLKAALVHPVAYVLALLLAGYYLLATAAFQLAPVAEAALLISTPPLFVLALRWAQGKLPAPSEIGGALLAIGGMALILVPKMSFSGAASMHPAHHLYGHLCALGAAALAAFYASTYRVLAEQGRAPEASGVSVLTFAIGAVALILMLALAPTPTGLSRLTGTTVLVLLGLGVLSTAVPTFGFALASKRLPAIVTATISLFVPLFSGLFAYLILGETISLWFVLGCLLVLGGVAMIIRQSRATNPA
jgi:drug/metabolite transporter, DME family